MTPADPLARLGVRSTSHGGELRVWSENATSIDLCLYDHKDPNWVYKTVPLVRDANGVWTGRSRSLIPGRRYTLKVDGPTGAEHPQNAFDATIPLLDPYARGIVRSGREFRSVMVDEEFNWNGVTKPNEVLYEDGGADNGQGTGAGNPDISKVDGDKDVNGKAMNMTVTMSDGSKAGDGDKSHAYAFSTDDAASMGLAGNTSKTANIVMSDVN